MKTTPIAFFLLLSFYFAYAQDKEEGLHYSLGMHGVDLTLNEQWNLTQKSKDYFELLYGCSGSQNCANIQIAFQGMDNWAGTDQVVAYVISEQKLNYPGLVYTQSQKKINDIEFEIIDFLIRVNGRFLGQTLVLFETNNEMATFTFTGELQKDNKQAPANYARERIRFMNILQSLKVAESEATPEPTKKMLLINCNNTIKLLITQKDSFQCSVKLYGKVFQETDEVVVMDKTVLRSFLAYKEPFLPEEDGTNSDNLAMYNFINTLSAQFYYAANPRKSKNYYYTLPLELPSERQAILWYAADYSPKKLKQMKSGKIKYPPVILGNIFVSLIVDDYIYSIQVFQGQDQSIEEIKELLSELIKTIEYTKGSFDYNILCEPTL